MSDFSPNARREIKRFVRAARSGAYSGLRGGEIDRPQGPTLWLARANAYVANGAVGTFTIRKPVGDKGSETDDTDETVDAYVRKGLCLADSIYLLLEVCAGEDTAFEVFNPTLEVVGKADANVAKSASGTTSVYSGTVGSETDTTENITAYNRYGDITSGKWVRCSWCDWGAGGWEETVAEC